MFISLRKLYKFYGKCLVAVERSIKQQLALKSVLLDKTRFRYYFFKLNFFTFSSQKGVCKKKKYCYRMIEKKIPSIRLSVRLYICLSVCLTVCTYVRTWILAVDIITFEGVSGFKQNLVDVFYV